MWIQEAACRFHVFPLALALWIPGGTWHSPGLFFYFTFLSLDWWRPLVSAVHALPPPRSSSSRLSHGCVLFQWTHPSSYLSFESTLTTVMLSANNTRSLDFLTGTLAHNLSPQSLEQKTCSDGSTGLGQVRSFPLWALSPLRDEVRFWLHAFQSLVGFPCPPTP